MCMHLHFLLLSLFFNSLIDSPWGYKKDWCRAALNAIFYCSLARAPEIFYMYSARVSAQKIQPLLNGILRAESPLPSAVVPVWRSQDVRSDRMTNDRPRKTLGTRPFNTWLEHPNWYKIAWRAQPAISQGCGATVSANSTRSLGVSIAINKESGLHWIFITRRYAIMPLDCIL